MKRFLSLVLCSFVLVGITVPIKSNAAVSVPVKNFLNTIHQGREYQNNPRIPDFAKNIEHKVREEIEKLLPNADMVHYSYWISNMSPRFDFKVTISTVDNITNVVDRLSSSSPYVEVIGIGKRYSMSFSVSSSSPTNLVYNNDFKKDYDTNNENISMIDYSDYHSYGKLIKLIYDDVKIPSLPNEGAITVNANVVPYVKLDIATDTLELGDISPITKGTGEISLTVESNANYKVSVQASDFKSSDNSILPLQNNFKVNETNIAKDTLTDIISSQPMGINSHKLNIEMKSTVDIPVKSYSSEMDIVVTQL